MDIPLTLYVTQVENVTENCNANADFIPVASGGDGSAVQFCELVHASIAETN